MEDALCYSTPRVTRQNNVATPSFGGELPRHETTWFSAAAGTGHDIGKAPPPGPSRLPRGPLWTGRGVNPPLNEDPHEQRDPDPRLEGCPVPLDPGRRRAGGQPRRRAPGGDRRCRGARRVRAGG